MTRRSQSRAPARRGESGLQPLGGPAVARSVSSVPFRRPPKFWRTNRTVQRLIACGRLRAHRIGRLVRIQDDDIAALLHATGLCDSRAGAYSLVLAHFSRMSGKHLSNRTSIYPLCVFPNDAPWPFGSQGGVACQKERPQ